jgi:hypothetical protein
MSGSNGAVPFLILRGNPDASGRFRTVAGVVQFDEAHIPIVLELRCRDTECCGKRTDAYPVHAYVLYDPQNAARVGTYTVVWKPFRDTAQLPVGARRAAGISGG